ncbi:MAG: class I SAM-dependent methyltransferase [Elusimicrobiota bacterium]
MNAIGNFHKNRIHTARSLRIGTRLAGIIPHNAGILDVGCGDGLVSSIIMKQRPDISIRGIDISTENPCLIPVEKFDGINIPFQTGKTEIVLIVDVLHHLDNPQHLLSEAARIASGAVMIKDHVCDRFLGSNILSFMDWVGNSYLKVNLPYNYWKKQKWLETFADMGFKEEDIDWIDDITLYPHPFEWFFGKSLNFICTLNIRKTS